MRAGRLLGNRYRLESCFEHDTTVWRARDTLVGRDVAIEVRHVNLASSPQFRRRFQSGASTVASLRSPHVVSLLDFGEEPTERAAVTSYLVMDLAPGRSLRTILESRGRLDADSTLDIIGQAATALHDAHSARITHGQLSAKDIFVDSEGFVRVARFGVACDPGDDIRDLGAIGYECLTGGVWSHDRPGQDLPAGAPSLPLHVSQPASSVVARALEVHPQRRWHSAAALAAACRSTEPAASSAPSDPLQVRPLSPETTRLRQRPHSSRQGRRAGRKTGLSVAAVVMSVLLTVTALAAVLWGDDDGPESAAVQDHSGSHAGVEAAPSNSDSSAETGSPSDGPDPRSADPEDSSPPQDPPTTSSPSADPTSRTPTASMPMLQGKRGDDAVQELEDEGFNDISTYQVGGGDRACGVLEQDPAPGVDHLLDSPVEVGVEYVFEISDCTHPPPQ